MAAINSINIETFRGINNLKLDNLAEVNILTGDNNSGKTSILEILQSLEAPDNFYTWIKLLRKGIFANRGLSYYEGFYDLFNINNDEKVIKYSIESQEKIMDILITAKEKEELDNYEQESMSIVYGENELEYAKEEIHSKLDMELYIDHKKRDSLSLYDDQTGYLLGNKKSDQTLKKNIVYISPIRHAEGGLFLNNVLDNPDLYEEMLEILKEYDSGIISINYDSKNERGMNRGVYKILSKSSQKALPLNVYGDGMKKAILLMSAVIKAKNGILLLDEFETAIHTSAMDKTFRWILRTCKKLNVQVFLTSHSKEAIDKILKCDPKITKDIAVYTLSKVKDKSVVRRLSGDKAIEVQDSMGLELR